MNDVEKPKKPGKGKYVRAGINAAAGAVPFVGGLISAASSYWSETEQENLNRVFQQWMQMLEDELREKGKTIAEVMARLDMKDEETIERVESPEYQSILKKVFRNWSSVDSEFKRERVRNILANSAATRISSDDVVKLFIDWITLYSDFHFQVIGEIYRKQAATRAEVWDGLSRQHVREDSADADLFKLLIRDLSTGGVIRQRRDTDAYGNFMRKPRSMPRPKGHGPKPPVSAFDDEEQYVLTELGQQFVAYAMNELTARIEFKETASDEMPASKASELQPSSASSAASPG